ncbi:MAG: hypothetical protein U9O87_02250, partial [Verrucomicrobiota bacterium]|nr:hypothetical protein [Verrucomicrobiota bacterium]
MAKKKSEFKTMMIKEKLIAIDFETTGVYEGHPEEPWQIGIVEIENGKVCVNKKKSSLLQVGNRPFNPYVPGRWASIRDEIADAPSF